VVKEVVRHVLSTGNTLSTLEEDSLIKKLSPLEEAKEETAKVVFFVGCYVDQDFRLHQVGKSAIEILKKNKISVAIPKDQICCGRPLLESGENKKVEELVRKNVLAIESTGIKEVVTVCPGCGLTLKEDYPLIFSRIEGRKPNFEVYDFSEYLLNKVKLDWKKLHKLDLEVTYHDPCHLNRGQGIHEQPRQIINSIPGVKLVEMEEPDRCCGAGGVIKAIDSQLAQIIAKRKAEMIKNLNIKAVITPCPTCMLQINQGLKLSKVKGVKVMHLTELLDQAL
jgi:fumarate reductase (CoM/CoB) subunit B